jgi:uncharacterized repeat protein (TIGR02543 family)
MDESLPVLTPRDAYTFAGWTADEGDTVVTSAEIHEAVVTEPVTYEAVFEESDIYSVVYNTNGESNISTLTEVKWGQSNLIPSEEPTRAGYTLRGWNVTSGGSGEGGAGKTSVATSDKYSELAKDDSTTSITLTAQWMALTTLTITNTVTSVTDGYVDTNREFSYTITLKDANSENLTGTFSYTGGGGKENGSLTLTNGAANFTLKHGQSIIIANVPADAKVAVAQTGIAQHTTSYTVTNLSGTGDSGSTGAGADTGLRDMSTNPGAVAFTNQRVEIVVSGLIISAVENALIMAGAIAAIAALAYYIKIKRRRRKGEA